MPPVNLGNKKIFILGTGGHARALQWLYPSATLVEPSQDASPALRDPSCCVLCGWVGGNCIALRNRIVRMEELRQLGVQVSEAPQVLPGATVDPSATLAEFVVVNQGAVVCHDCRIGVGAHIGPGAVLCGEVTIGAYAFIGAGAVVLPGTTVPRGFLVRAGTKVSMSGDGVVDD
jgi:serine acetyltransferase